MEEVNKDYHSDKITKEQSFTFSFYNTYFKVFTKREYSVIYYRELYKIFETDTFFYLYLDNRHSLLLDKSGFKKGTPITFRDFIKKKCPFKYKLDKLDNEKKETKKLDKRGGSHYNDCKSVTRITKTSKRSLHLQFPLHDETQEIRSLLS